MTGWRRWARRLVLTGAALYPLALLLTALLLRALGESWWLARVTLYFPRVLFALPLPLFVLGLALLRAWRFMFTQVVALGLVLFPLMGLVSPWFHGGAPGAPVLRVLSYNVNSGFWGWDRVLAQIDELRPDVILMQELLGDPGPAVAHLRAQYPSVHSSTQFLVASRYPILSSDAPEPLSVDGHRRSQRWIRHVIDTPLGQLAFYNVHPISPRGGIMALRYGFLDSLQSGSLLRGEKARRLQTDGRLRDLQVETFAGQADRETLPVIIAGDFNLPGLSPALGYLSKYRDGFRAAGRGFGYTYPVGRRAWMRLDRIYASPSLHFVSFEVGRHTWASDHHCVVADLQRSPP